MGRSAPIAIRKLNSDDAKRSSVSHHIVNQDYVLTVPSRPVLYRFASQRLASGICLMVGACFAVCLGGYFASEIDTAHPLQGKVAFAAAVYLLLGLGMLPFAVRDLFGKLSADVNGIRVTGGPGRFRITWEDLDRWKLDSTGFRLHSRSTGVTESIALNMLSARARTNLFAILNCCAPEKRVTTRIDWSNSRRDSESALRGLGDAQQVD